MEIGNEISQKIRSAIKAKLVDLGAYVDDELPDYIMVMVANKKSQQQMTADLNLFLGDNTAKFTAWLHNLLSKLKSVATDPAKDAGTSKAAELKAADEAKARAGKTGKDASGETEEPELTLRPDKDEFEEEQMMTETKTRGQGSAAGSSVSSQQPPTAAKSSRVPRARRPAVLTKQASDPDREKTKDKDATLEPESRKRKMLGSVVTAVPLPPEEPEEEYDPTKPMIGRVASTVKVGERRPTVPPSRQASKALVMRAMSEAKESVESSTHRQKQVERVRPIQQRLGQDSEYLPARGRGRGMPQRFSANSARDELHLTSHYQSSARGPASRMRSAAMPAPRRLTKPDPPAKVESERSVSLVSCSRREEELQRLRFEAEEANTAKREAQMRQVEHAVAEVVVKRESPEMDWANEAELEEKKLIETSGSEAVYHPTPIQDSRQVTCDKLKQGVIQEQRTISVKPRISESSNVSQDMDMLIESGADYEISDRRLVQESTPIKENPPSPKFVVTLEGVEGMVGRQDISDVFMEDDESHGPRNIVRVKPQPPFSPDMDRPMYSDDIDDGDLIPMKTKRMPERCRFWPACMKVDTCPFHHPTDPCKNFPNCRFGSTCLYVHPQCKFDGRCTRPDCPFTHQVKRQAPSRMPVMLQAVGVLPMQPSLESPSYIEHSAAPKPTPCKFFPNCTNMNCPFLHPKACRYGSMCRNQPHCTFSHPPLPSKDQMKWTASSQPSATTTTSSSTPTSPS